MLCDLTVHVGGRRTHGRYLLFRRRVEFPGDKPGRLEDLAMQPIDPVEILKEQAQAPEMTTRENLQNHRVSFVPMLVTNPNVDEHGKIDLNAKPNWINGQTSNNHVQCSDTPNGCCQESQVFFLEDLSKESQRSDNAIFEC